MAIEPRNVSAPEASPTARASGGRRTDGVRHQGHRCGAPAAAALLLAIASCAPAPPPRACKAAGHPLPTPTAAISQAISPRPLPGSALSAAEVEAELSRLHAAFLAEVPPRAATSPDRDAVRISLASSALAAGGTKVEAPQLLLLVDRNPAVQEASIVLARPEAGWAVIGGTRVSTGQAGRRDYYLTLLGVFAHTDAILDWRAEGTFNENGIRGLGLRGMRVRDFGWQEAT